MCATAHATAKIWLLFCYLFNSDGTALFLWAAQKVEDVLKISCLLLILFCLQVHFHTTAALRASLLCFQPCAPRGFWELNPNSGEVQSKAAVSHQLYSIGSQNY